MTSSDDYEKDRGKDQDVWHQPLSRVNAKEAFMAFLGECGVQLIFYVMLGTTVGAMIWVGLWLGVLLIPLAMTVYYLFKKIPIKKS